MKNIRIITCILLCLCCVVPMVCASSEDASALQKWAKGTVQANETIRVYAPIGGQIEAFSLAAGDDIAEGEMLMHVKPTEVLAPYDGILKIEHAKVGDTAQNVINSYGALCYIERQDVQWMRTTTDTAYRDAKNRDIRIGEPLRVYNGRSSGSDKKEADGRVVSVDGSSYVVEFPINVFDIEEEVRVYRGTGSEYSDGDMVGRGNVERVAPIAVTAEGVIAEVIGVEGQTVSRGDPLYAIDAMNTSYETSPVRYVSAQKSGVLKELYVQGGQQVVKGQLLMSITSLENLECVVEVDELDILSLALGQAVRVKVDAQPDVLLTATIEKIAPLGIKELDTTKYEVTVRLAIESSMLLPGMHVTAYWD